jgi:hypothetical protein
VPPLSCPIGRVSGTSGAVAAASVAGEKVARKTVSPSANCNGSKANSRLAPRTMSSGEDAWYFIVTKGEPRASNAL